jgi:hypothetical protein
MKYTPRIVKVHWSNLGANHIVLLFQRFSGLLQVTEPVLPESVPISLSYNSASSNDLCILISIASFCIRQSGDVFNGPNDYTRTSESFEIWSDKLLFTSEDFWSWDALLNHGMIVIIITEIK